MSRNVEIKARISPKENLLRSLECHADRYFDIAQRDTFFQCANGRLKLRTINGTFSELIYYQRPDVFGPKVSNYFRWQIKNPNELLLLLSTILGIRGIVSKKRRVYLFDQTRVHIDEVDQLGHFLEIEVVLNHDQTIIEGYYIACALLNDLGVSESMLVNQSYIDLLTPSNAGHSRSADTLPPELYDNIVLTGGNP